MQRYTYIEWRLLPLYTRPLIVSRPKNTIVSLMTLWLLALEPCAPTTAWVCECVWTSLSNPRSTMVFTIESTETKAKKPIVAAWCLRSLSALHWKLLLLLLPVWVYVWIVERSLQCQREGEWKREREKTHNRKENCFLLCFLYFIFVWKITLNRRSGQISGSSSETETSNRWYTCVCALRIRRTLTRRYMFDKIQVIQVLNCNRFVIVLRVLGFASTSVGSVCSTTSTWQPAPQIISRSLVNFSPSTGNKNTFLFERRSRVVEHIVSILFWFIFIFSRWIVAVLSFCVSSILKLGIFNGHESWLVCWSVWGRGRPKDKEFMCVIVFF